MERSSRYCQELGIAAHAEFHTAAIRNFTPKMQPDIVLALHAYTFRATLLKLTGYRTDALEFVSTEHTPRNILIRAVKQHRRLPATERAALAAEYRALKQYWGVVPHLEKLLAEGGLLKDADI
eukprot:gene8866-9045_t